MKEFRDDVDAEVSAILASDFNINVTDTKGVPHSSDAAITFPNTDTKTQSTKLLETTVLYVDMRRSTALSFEHRRQTVARLYSAFVRAMTRAANYFDGEVRGIIGDRVLILFDQKDCFKNAYSTAVLMNTVCQKIINRHFKYNEVEFGIGIDYGRMLATKTGIRRHGTAQQSYRSLVWLGRPANIASKLTDNANKPEETFQMVWANVCYRYPTGEVWVKEVPHQFIKNFTFNPLTRTSFHSNPAFEKWTALEEKVAIRPKTPPILMTKVVYDGVLREDPNRNSVVNKLITPIANLKIKEYPDTVYGCDVVYTDF